MKCELILPAYSRPDKFLRLIDFCVLNWDEGILISHDGCRNSNEFEDWKRVRDICESFARLPNVKVILHEKNIGIDSNIPLAVTQSLISNDACIVVEDDLILSNDFFRVMKDSLSSIQALSTIAHVSGRRELKINTSMNWIELEYVSVHGWGTLAERWKFYEEFPPESSIDIYRLFIDSRKTKLEKIYWSQRFKEIQKNMHIEWDVNWTLSLWKQNFKSLVTPINLVSYDGVDSVATHTTSQLKRFKNRIIDSIDLPLPPASTSYVSSTQSMANTRLMFSINSARYLEPFLRKLGFYSLMKKSLFWFDSYIRTDIFLKIINNWRLKNK